MFISLFPNIRIAFLLAILLFSFLSHAEKPNIVYILADDMGVGDVQALNPEGKIPTPNIDRLTRNGMTFTNAHSASSVCTPTRYSILTGRYNWRTRLSDGVLWGYSQPLIKPDEMTVGKLLQGQGYATACIGKWHLGMDWTLKEGGLADTETDEDPWSVDYTKTLTNGPTTRGFDEFFGISASLDMFPFVFIENDHMIGEPSLDKKIFRKGPAEKDFEGVDVLPALFEKGQEFIKEHAEAARAGDPFFLYLPLSAPHTPILPTPEWQGKSAMNAYADFVMQVDAGVGEIMKTLLKTGVLKNTIIVFTTDNGCSPQANFAELAKHGHNPSYVYRGHKADIYEGGHRVPFIVQWLARVPAGTTSEHPVCQSDLIATVADILDVTLEESDGVDSFTMLPVLTTTKSESPLREYTVHHSINGSFAISHGDWKLALCPGSGGWSAPRPGKSDLSKVPPLQLFNLKDDIGETKNVAKQHPEKVTELQAVLQDYVDRGRSTPGSNQTNDRTIDILAKVPAKKAEK